MQLDKKKTCKAKCLHRRRHLFVRNYNHSSYRNEQKGRERRASYGQKGSIDIRHARQKKVCNEEEEEENQLSFPHQKRLFWLSVPDAKETRALPILSSGSCCPFVRGTMCRNSRTEDSARRETVENKSKRHCRRDTSGKLIGSKSRSHARTKETLKRGGV